VEWNRHRQRIGSPEELGGAGKNRQAGVAAVPVRSKVQADDLYVFFDRLAAVGLSLALGQLDLYLAHKFLVHRFPGLGGIERQINTQNEKAIAFERLQCFQIDVRDQHNLRHTQK